MNTLRDKIKTLKVLAYETHFHVDDDNWYSCPLAPDGCADDRQGTLAIVVQTLIIKKLKSYMN